MAQEKIDNVPLVNAKVWDPMMLPLGYASNSALSSAAALPSIPAGARVAMLQAEDANLRYRDDGTNPTVSAGMLLAAGESIWYNGDLAAIKFIEVASGGRLNVSYYGAEA